MLPCMCSSSSIFLGAAYDILTTRIGHCLKLLYPCNVTAWGNKQWNQSVPEMAEGDMGHQVIDLANYRT